MKHTTQHFKRYWVWGKRATGIGLLLIIAVGSSMACDQVCHKSKAKRQSYPELAISQYGKYPYFISESGALVPLDYDTVMSDVYQRPRDPTLFQVGYDGLTLYCGGLQPSTDAHGMRDYVGDIEAYHLSPHARFHYLGIFADTDNSDYPFALASGAKGRFLYVLTVHNLRQSQFCALTGFRVARDGSVFPLRGMNIPLGKPTELNPEIVSDRAGKFIYVSNTQNNTVSEYKVIGNGSLVSLSSKILKLPQRPSHMFFHPNGHYLYIAGADTNTLMRVPVNQNGTLAQPSVMVLGTDKSRATATMTPNGRFLYARDYKSGGTEQFRINSDGTLHRLSPAVIAAFPYAISVDLTSHFVYLSEKILHGNNIIRQYKITSTGVLVPLKVPMIIAPSTDPVYLLFMRQH